MCENDSLGFAVVHVCCQQHYTAKPSLSLTIRTFTDSQVHSVKLHALCHILHMHIVDMVPPIYCEYMYATVN